MPIRTTVDIPDVLHEKLRVRAEQTGKSIRSLIVSAIEQTYTKPRKGRYVTGPMIEGGKRGPLFPTNENPYDLMFP